MLANSGQEVEINIPKLPNTIKIKKKQIFLTYPTFSHHLTLLGAQVCYIRIRDFFIKALSERKTQLDGDFQIETADSTMIRLVQTYNTAKNALDYVVFNQI